MDVRPLSYRSVVIVLWASLCVLFCGCIPKLRQKSPGAQFPVMNEKIFLYPVIDSSSLELLEGWPVDKPVQDILRRHFRTIDGALLADFRQCEKYGLYEMVEDSLLSSIRVTVVVGRFEFKKDMLSFPLRMNVRRMTDNTDRPFAFIAVGMYRAASRPKSAVHYLDMLLADFRRHFPYRKMSGVFFGPMGNRKGRP
jgi:hypothetical protein